MWPYWIMFLLPAWAVLAPGRLPARQTRWAWFAVGLAFTLMMGFRHEVGGDWENYLSLFNRNARFTFDEVLGRGDPGFYGINWLVAHAGGSVYEVNLISAAMMMWGTVVFCRAQPKPWLALLAAVPFMLIVVGMGYTRQAIALGFALLGLAALGNRNVRTFVIWVAIGATFHKSAVMLLPIAALAASRNRVLTGSLVMVTTGLLYYLLLADASEALWTSYVTAEYQSQGAMIRVLMNAVPAVLFLIYRKRLAPDQHERKLWMWIAFFALVCLPLVSLASTAVDRVALYLIPLQLFVFSRMPLQASNVKTRTLIVLGIVAYYAAVQFVWLNYAVHSQYWLPYQFMPLD